MLDRVRVGTLECWLASVFAHFLLCVELLARWLVCVLACVLVGSRACLLACGLTSVRVGSRACLLACMLSGVRFGSRA